MAKRKVETTEQAVSNAPVVGIGAMVGYVMPSGAVRPGVVVAVHSPTCVNLQVFVDGRNDGYSLDQVALWMVSVDYSPGKEEGTWHELSGIV